MDTAKMATANQTIIPFKGKTDAGFGRALLYALCAALYSVIAVSGLFLGFFFRNAPLGRIIAGGEPIFRGSLLGVIVEIVRGSLAVPRILPGLQGVLPFVLFCLVIVLVGVIALSLVLTILAFLRPRRARRYASFSGECVFLCYAALFLTTLFYRALTSEALDRSLFDFPTLVAASAALLPLLMTAAARKGIQGIAGGLLLLWALAGLLAFAVPGSPLLQLLEGAFMARPSVLQIACLVCGGMLLINLLFSILRLNAGRGRGFDALRFGLQFAASIVLAGIFLGAGGSFSEFFKEPFSATLLFLAPLCGFLLAAFAAGRNRAPTQKKRNAARSASED